MICLAENLASEGESISESRWQWNKTIGPLVDRPGRPGTWGYENTDGLGLIEYLHVCTLFLQHDTVALLSRNVNSKFQKCSLTQSSGVTT